MTVSNHNTRGVARTISGRLLVVGVLVFVAVLVAGLAPRLTGKGGFVSPEVKFTDASAGGMQIVPASCASYPHYLGDCSGVGGTCPPDQHDTGTGGLADWRSNITLTGVGCVCNLTGATVNASGVCVCPVGQISNGVSCVPVIQPQTCTCPVGFVVSGSSCIPTSTTYTPGTYDVQVPNFTTMTVELYGAGGGGASYYIGTDAMPGGETSIASLLLVARGGEGGKCDASAAFGCPLPVPSGGAASGGSTNSSGGNGSCFPFTFWGAVSAGGTAANGGPGVGGNGSSAGVTSYSGGGGGYTSKVYYPGDIAVGSFLHLVVGSGGQNGPCWAADASNGGPGKAVISVVPAGAAPAVSCTCPSGYAISGTTCVHTCLNGLNAVTYPSCTCAAGKVQSGSSCVPTSCSNGLNSVTYPSCTCPAGQVQSGSSCVVTSCSNGLNAATYPSCTCPAGQVQSGSTCIGSCTERFFCQNTTDLYRQTADCNTALFQICSWGCAGDLCLPKPLPTITLNVVPLLVRQNRTAQVTWSSTLMSSCTVTSTNGSSWSPDTIGTQTSLPIRNQTIFTARCIASETGATYTKSATANIIPAFCEPGTTGC